MSSGMSSGMSQAVVIKIGGSTLEDVGRLAPLWSALVQVARTRPIVLVHGGGKAVDALLKRLDLPVERKNGLRVTPPDQIDLITGVLAGSVNKQVVGALNAAGGRAVGLCLGDGKMVESRVLSQDLGRVGEVTGGDARVLADLLAAGYLPVVSSIGIDAAGASLNINADDGAAAIARALRAASLVLLTDVPGIKGGDGVLRPTLTASAIEQMILAGEITGGMIVKARSAAGVSKSTGAGVVILSGETPEPLLGFLAGRTVGTTVRG